MNAILKGLRNSLRCAFASVLIVWTLTGNATPPPAGIVPIAPPTGGFAIDGNLLANTPGANVGDWLRMTNIANGTGGSVLSGAGLPLNNLITFHFTDPYGSDDSVFKGGYKWFENPNNWTWTTNKASPKADINNALVHISSDPDGHVWVVISADRLSTSGDSYIDFEFLQNSLTRSGSSAFVSTGPHGGRTTNDVLLSLAFTSGGSVADCFVWRWLPDGNGGFAYTNATAGVPAGRFFVALNTNSIAVPYGAFGQTNYEPNAFAEAGVDLTALLSVFDPCLSIGVRTILIKTKASQSDTATIEDFIDPIQYSLRIGPSADAGPDQKRCLEGSETLFHLPGVATPGIFPLVSNIWTVVSGTATIDSPQSLITTARVSSASATLRLRVYQANGCTEFDDVILTVASLPTCSITGGNSMCPGSSAQFTAPAGMTYNWSITGNGSISGASTQSVVTVVAGSACSQNFTLTLNVSSNGCSSSCTKDVTVEDTTPPTISCPNDLVLDCPADTRTNSTGVAIAQDNCGLVTVIYNDAITDGCAGTKVIERTWTATDRCGNTKTCVQTITVRDISKPSIHCPADLVLEYPANVDPGATGVATATDSCSTPTVTHSDSVTAGCGNTMSIVRTWTAMDACGNSVSCDQLINVVDTTKPMISCLLNKTMECTAAWDFDEPTASDTGGNVTLVVVGTVTNTVGRCGNTFDATRIWRATDECGNSAECSQKVTVVDTTKPTMTCVGDKTVECTAAWDFDAPTASDTCGSVNITIVGTTTNRTGRCGNTFDATRTWRATDDCGNYIECTQTVTVEDTTNPGITCAADKTVECTATWDFDTPTANDSCGTVAISVVSTVTNRTDRCGQTFDAIRTWRATDDCGNFVECSQKVTIVDTTKPTMTCGGDKTVECTAAWDFDAPAASDTCGSVSITVVSTTTNRIDHCGNTFDATRTWRATDDCGNFVECSQKVTLVDTTKPTITCIGDKTVECTAAWDFDAPSASDSCGGVSITVVSTTTNRTDHCGNTFDATRTWRATDDCGNFAECSQKVTVVDTTKPTITCVADKTVECTAAWNFDAPSASDTCGNATITIVSTTTNKTGRCGNTFDATRTWRATDDCGNFAECSQKVTVLDTTKPTITCVADKTVECTAAWNFDAPSASDTCGNATITIVSTTTNKNGRCGNTFDATRTWRATDDCGNFAECSQNVTVLDTTKPTITCVADKTVECTAAWNFDAPSASDTCGNAIVTVVSTTTNKTGRCGNTFDATRTWRATDDCGNLAECSQKVTVLDTTKPTITCIADKTVECTAAWNFDAPSASDTCGNATITIVSTTTNKTGRCGNTFDATRTWRATDDCGNFAECSQKVTVVDTTKPTITCVADKTVECTAAWNFDAPSASDTCGNATITIVSTTTNKTGRCGNTFDTTRTWRATDDCGNFAECSQKVTVLDTTKPTITCVADKTVECTAAWNFDAPAAEDSCGTATVTVMSTSTNRVGHCGNTFDATRVWRATDQCGNFAECSQKVTVVDTTKPTITCIGDKTVECTTAWNFDPPSASDTCGNANVTIVSTTTNKTGHCGNTFDATRRWRATDDCGNFAECSQTVTVVDTTKPTISCPQSVVLECPADTRTNFTGVATAQDGCGSVTVLFSDAVTTNCGNARVIARTWTAIDDCGNSSSCVQTITVQDTLKPTIICPPDKNIECSGDTSPAATGTATAQDGCGTVTIRYTDVVTPGCGTTRTIARTWTATDACSNSVSCVQTIAVRDTTAPALTLPANRILQCPGDTRTNVTGVPVVSDGCGSYTLTYSDVVSNGCAQTRTVLRTWTAVDICGNSTNGVQIISVVDSTKPTITCPTINVQCVADLPAPYADLAAFRATGGTATDSCSSSLTFSLVSDSGLVGRCPGNLTRVYRVTDACGNFADCTQTITVNDTIAPVLTCPTNNITVECGVSLADAGRPTATDNCSTNVNLTYSDTPVSSAYNINFYAADPDLGTGPYGPTYIKLAPSSLARPVGRALDPLRNAVAYSTNGALDALTSLGGVPMSFGQIIPFEAVIQASGGPGPERGTIEFTVNFATYTTSNDRFGFDTNYMVYAAFVDAADPGSLDPNVNARVESFSSRLVNSGTINEQIQGTFRVSGIDSGDQVIVEIWMVFSPSMPDHSGGGTVAVQLVSAEKVLTPAEPISIGSKTISLGNLNKTTALPPPQTQPPLGPLPPQPPVPPGVTISVIDRTWAATDDCGNRSTCVQRVTVRDNSPPMLSAPDMVLECPADTRTNMTGVATAPDCSGPVVLTYSDSVTTSCAGTKVIARKWTASDFYGNSTNIVQTITVRDTTPPAMICPANAVLECSGDTSVAARGTATAQDLCGSASVSFSDTVTDICRNTRIIARTWTAIDECGNRTNAVQTITVQDTTAPTIVCQPDRTVEFGDAWTFAQPAASDTCGTVSLRIVSTTTNLIGQTTCLATRTWEAVDECGNKATCQQSFTVLNAVPPTLFIRCIDPTHVEISWVAPSSGFQLEVSDSSFTSPWAPVLVTPTVTNGMNVVVQPASQPQKFYRLRKAL